MTQDQIDSRRYYSQWSQEEIDNLDFSILTWHDRPKPPGWVERSKYMARLEKLLNDIEIKYGKAQPEPETRTHWEGWLERSEYMDRLEKLLNEEERNDGNAYNRTVHDKFHDYFQTLKSLYMLFLMSTNPLGNWNILEDLEKPNQVALHDINVTSSCKLLSKRQMVQMLLCFDPTYSCKYVYIDTSTQELMKIVTDNLIKALNMSIYPQNATVVSLKETHQNSKRILTLEFLVKVVKLVKSVTFSVNLRSGIETTLMQDAIALTKGKFLKYVLPFPSFDDHDAIRGVDFLTGIVYKEQLYDHYFCPNDLFSYVANISFLPNYTSNYGVCDAKNFLHHHGKVLEDELGQAIEYVESVKPNLAITIINEDGQKVALRYNEINLIDYYPIGHYISHIEGCKNYTALSECIESCWMAFYDQACKEATIDPNCIPLHYRFVLERIDPLCPWNVLAHPSFYMYDDNDTIYTCEDKTELEDRPEMQSCITSCSLKNSTVHCNRILYRVQHSSYGDPSHQIYPKTWWSQKTDKSYEIKYEAIISIISTGVAFPEFTEDYAISFSNFMADLGGLADFWLGISVISLVHALIYLMELTKRITSKIVLKNPKSKVHDLYGHDEYIKEHPIVREFTSSTSIKNIEDGTTTTNAATNLRRIELIEHRLDSILK